MVKLISKWILILILLTIIFSCKKNRGDYVCKPCDLPCDTLTFSSPGICPHCNMELVKKSEVINEAKLLVNEINLSTGSGVFLVEGGKDRKEKSIKVYYHQPKNFTADSKILIVLPGAGRNGDGYRDAWEEASEKYNVLILSPMYSEEDYPFEDYHLGGLIKKSNLRDCIEFVENTNIAKLDEAKFKCEINKNQSEWIFKDFDRIFNLVVNACHSSQNQYDIFGHSAGGQILHRMAIFNPTSKANRIIAANSGFYTLPNFETTLPFGIKNTLLKKEDLKNSFNQKLILLIGENDNVNETGGTLLRSPTVDQQGFDRLERGQYFYEISKKIAAELKTDFNWKINLVPNVGHDHRRMRESAAKVLYGKN
ncbi:MAG: hypothetical protein AB8H03_18465 [Saprospiraceae bacterium]